MLIDISWPISEDMTEYKDKKSVKIEQTSKFEIDQVREKLITFNTHTGTHIDAPAHFLKDGKTLGQISLDKFYGRCKVFDLTKIQDKITESDLQIFSIEKDDIVIFKTRNSDLNETDKFDRNFVYLEKTGAQFLANKKIKTFGFDYLGIESNQPNHETHKFFLEQEILIIEGLRLKQVEPGEYILSCFPLFLKNTDGAPARAVLIKT